MKAGRRLLFAALSALVLFGAAEVVARLVPEASPAGDDLMVAHPTRLWALQPGAHRFGGRGVTVDQDGLRATMSAPPQNAPLILTLGDSSVFSHGVEDGRTLHDALQAQLQQSGVAASVRCAAVPGYSILQTRRLLDELWELEPRLLVVGNLWSDNNARGVRDADLLAALGRPAVQTRFALRGSALFRRIDDQLRPQQASPQVGWTQHSEVGVRRVPLQQYGEELDALLEDARERGVGVVVLALTNQEIQARGRVESDSWTPYFQVQAQVAARRGVPLVDAAAALQREGQRNDLFTDPMHPSERGTWLIAQELVEALMRAGWPQQAMVPQHAQGEVVVGPDPFDGNIALPPADMLPELLRAAGVAEE
jgi:GDSL-like Lipase/Acylhydrolase family